MEHTEAKTGDPLQRCRDGRDSRLSPECKLVDFLGITHVTNIVATTIHSTTKGDLRIDIGEELKDGFVADVERPPALKHRSSFDF